jgi:hypothetical protein
MDKITPSRPYHRPEFLLDIYRFMEKFERENQVKPSIQDIVDAKFSPSTSVVRFYLSHMEKLGMITHPRILRNGKLITPSRSIILLRLENADPLIRNIVKINTPIPILKEKDHERKTV